MIKEASILNALLATTFTWSMSALGALVVYFFKEVHKKLIDAMLGFSAGIMISASFFSLLSPAIEMTKGQKNFRIIPATGFLLGSLFLFILDKIIPHLHLGLPLEGAEGIKTHFSRNVLLFIAVTLHNIPEGLAVGVAFGALSDGGDSLRLQSALTLALGIGIQNFPEGIAISLPFKVSGLSNFKSFFFGQISAIVEPIAGVTGAIGVMLFKPLLPYALSFATGAMIYVVLEELLPESHSSGNTDISTISALAGFLIMMLLDIYF
ncbi:MAG: ZIP family metal transporter [Candidatus Aminicenantia bacterium]